MLFVIIFFAVLNALIISAAISQINQRERSIKKLREENKYLRRAIANKAQNAVEMLGDILSMENEVQSAQKEKERLEEENKALTTQLKVKTKLFEQLQRGEGYARII